MHAITKEEFIQLLDQARIKPRMKREVRFTTSVAHVDDEEWVRTELLPISDRSENKGVLLVQFDTHSLYAASYEISRGLMSSTGKAQAVICDFCRTWQTGSRAGSITLQKPKRGEGSITFLCCADLACSKHVRNLTAAAKTSRSQLREDLDNDQRVARLKERLKRIVNLLGLEKVSLENLNEA